MRRLMLLAAFALAACGKAEEPRPAPPAPDVAININQPLDARGTEPEWSLTIRGVQLTLSRPGTPDLVATAPGAVVLPSQASWTAAMADGRTMKVVLYTSACTEGVSETNYSYSAEVTLPDASPLTGCAGPHAAPPRVAKR
jgi:uncharacterized membrane protein